MHDKKLCLCKFWESIEFIRPLADIIFAKVYHPLAISYLAMNFDLFNPDWPAGFFYGTLQTFKTYVDTISIFFMIFDQV